ncbi:hypothetical protein KI372_03465 [Halobacterium salinarum]|uniref:hypothetical protein n=1 Tax=Halobacterium salinarum TaxID=2242 RepID=UPI001F47332A|nr:hypothetical protein [Halobacterium salinarum]MCF2206825.1 hypothetical protein [Halobacterium salinarum]MCF2240488.1 hypothetical protein [Halobacterium salinarum]
MTWSEATPVFGAFLVCLGSGLLAVSAVSGHPAGLTEQSGLLVAAGVAFVLAGCLSVARGVGTGVRPAVVGSDRTDAES